MKPIVVRFVVLPLISFCCLLLANSNQEIVGQHKDWLLTSPDRFDGKDALVPKRIQGNDLEYCLNCHRLTESEKSNPEWKKATREIITYEAVLAFIGNDLHRFAYRNIVPDPIGGPQGKPNLAHKMQTVLQGSRGETYSVNKAAECLVCHSVDAGHDPKTGKWEPISKSLVYDSKDPRFDIRFGVSCEACHGIVQEGWQNAHVMPRWRTYLPSYKSSVGQIDLRDPNIRSEICASCHIGNREQGKFITHEMYAAGHPLLIPFEVATFSRDPAHFYPSNQTPYFRQEAAKERDGEQIKGVSSVQERFHYRDGEFGEIRQMAYGSLIKLRSSLRLLESELAKKDGEAVDIALFDCASCHSEYKELSASGAKPPRVASLWLHRALPEIVVNHAASSEKTTSKIVELAEQYKMKLNRLEVLVQSNPLGTSPDIAPASLELQRIINDLMSSIAVIKYDLQEVIRLEDLLVKSLKRMAADHTQPARLLDFENTQIMIWAVQAIRHELGTQTEVERATLSEFQPPKRPGMADHKDIMRHYSYTFRPVRERIRKLTVK